MELGLKNKVAVVAAASQGLGRAIAEAVAAEGARVALCSRDKARIEAAAADIRRRTSAEVLPVVADVTYADDVDRFVAAAVKRWGTVHVAVANAGGPPAKEFAQISLDDWQKAVNLNLMSAVHLARAVLPRMREQKWGRLIFFDFGRGQGAHRRAVAFELHPQRGGGPGQKFGERVCARQRARQHRLPGLHAHGAAGRAGRHALAAARR